MTKFYRVGGAVRDQIMELKSKDIDYSVETDSFDSMRQAIIDRGGVIFLETPQYFTIRAKIGREAADFVLCRKESNYSDGRRPDVVEIGTIYDDLARRDFTMNAIAIDEDGKFIDPHNGIEDIKNKRIKCVGDCFERFNEDYLRMLRAVRFAITKEMILDYTIDYILRIPEVVQNLAFVATDRVRDEMTKMFVYSSPLAIHYIFKKYYHIGRVIMQNHNIWLKPTSEER